MLEFKKECLKMFFHLLTEDWGSGKAVALASPWARLGWLTRVASEA